MDTLRFGTNASALTSGQLAQISFSNYGGVGGAIDGLGNVSPIPEPSTYAAILGALAFAARRRLVSQRRS